ncbi:MAG: hypothetical protein AB1491_13635 [Thermodesulfobacteriota bacterium]
MADLLVQGITGLAVLLFWGGLLVLSAFLLSRLVERGEPGATPAGWPGEVAAEPRGPEPLAPPRLTAGIGRGEVEIDPLTAAAIALALALYQEEGQMTWTAPAPAGIGAAWSWAGRWQAMQARVNLRQKR